MDAPTGHQCDGGVAGDDGGDFGGGLVFAGRVICYTRYCRYTKLRGASAAAEEANLLRCRAAPRAQIEPEVETEEVSTAVKNDKAKKEKIRSNRIEGSEV